MSMQEFKILGHIDLPERKIKPEEYRELLENKMLEIGNEVNEQFGYKFLDKGGNILMAEHQDLVDDENFVVGLEEEWANRQYKTVEEWRKSKDRNPATITEMAVTLVLHRLLSDRFIVARASTFDDYKYGVDNVLIDKKTGAVVCGFDEVLGYEGDDGGEKKDEKIKKSLAHGGTSLKYGATIEDGKIKRQELKNIPTFYLSLSKEELSSLLKDLKSNNQATENEKHLVLKMLSSLDKQYSEAKDIASNQVLKENLDKFADSFEIIKQEINKN
jgi:hypothetical protein